MSGSVSRPREKLYRYYIVPRGGAPHHAGEGLSKQIPAEALEEIVLNKLKEVLLDMDGLRERVVGAVILTARRASQAAGRYESLVKERHTIAEEFEFIIMQLGKLGREVLKDRTSQLEAKLSALDNEIKRAKPEHQPTPEDAEGIADSIIEQIQTLAGGIDRRCNVSIRRLLEILVAKMTVDMDTGKLEIEFRLPSWTLAKSVRLDRVHVHGLNVETNAKNALLLGFFSCPYRKKRNDRCFICSRLAQAA